MKNIRTCFITLISTTLLVHYALTASAKPASNINKTVRLNQKIAEKKHLATDKSRETIIKEAVMALTETKKAIDYLDKKDKQKALDSLAMVVGKLDLILARQPGLALAPVDVHLETYDIYASISEIKKAVKKSKILLDEGNVQAAREILSSLASEIDVVITSLPLATYPQAIKKIAKLVDKGKLQEAKYALYDLLNTLVITRHVIPLPILRAEELLKQAEKLTEKKDRSNKDNKELNTLLSQAKKQLQMAEILGYGDKKDYEEFYLQISKIEKQTKHNKYGKGFFDELKESLTKFKNKIFNKKLN